MGFGWAGRVSFFQVSIVDVPVKPVPLTHCENGQCTYSMTFNDYLTVSVIIVSVLLYLYYVVVARVPSARTIDSFHSSSFFLIQSF